MKHIFKTVIVWILTLEARLLLWRTKPKIIGITGSVGKTSTKDAIFSVIKTKVHARKSDKSFNSEIGVPLTILGLPNAWSNPFLWIKNIIDGAIVALFPGRYPEWLILEIGVDHPGDIERLMKWLTPDIAVLTQLPDVPVHVEYFNSPEEVIAEKRKLVDALHSNGVLVFNNDDPRVVAVKESVRQRSVGYSRYSNAPFMASGDVVAYENSVPRGISFVVTHAGEEVSVSVSGSLGAQLLYSYTAAMAVGSLFDMTLRESADALSRHEPPSGRMRLIPGVKKTTIIDDTYNSSPIATASALQTLKEIKTYGRKIAVLGDMLELGQYSAGEHEKAGHQVAHVADILVTVGVRARGIAEGALAMGMQESAIMQFEDSLRAGKEIEMMLEEDDLVLVKGSQGIRTERVVEEIMAEPQRAPLLLVRQDRAWQEI